MYKSEFCAYRGVRKGVGANIRVVRAEGRFARDDNLAGKEAGVKEGDARQCEAEADDKSDPFRSPGGRWRRKHGAHDEGAAVDSRLTESRLRSASGAPPHNFSVTSLGQVGVYCE